MAMVPSVVPSLSSCSTKKFKKDTNIVHSLMPHLLKEAGADPHGSLLLHQLQELLLGEWALLQVHAGCKQNLYLDDENLSGRTKKY